MELEQLRGFLKIAELESVTLAAEELGRSQSGLSRSLQRLESELGRPVFERLARRMVLTEAGRLLQDHARRAIATLDDVRRMIDDDGQTGRLRIGAIPTIAPYFLPAVLREFRRRFPQATVGVHEEVTQQLLQRLQQGELDLAILALPIDAKSLSVVKLFREPLLLVIARDHPLAKAKRISLKQVESYPFVLLGEAHCLSENVVSYCRQRSVQPVATERTSQLATIQELVALGHGISLVPQMAARADESKRRVYRELAAPVPMRTIGVAWNPSRYQSRLQSAFIQLLKEGCS